MKASTKQILKVTLDINRTFHRWAIQWDDEWWDFDGRKQETARKCHFAVRAIIDKLNKALQYGRGSIRDYGQDKLVYVLFAIGYWFLSRFAFTLTGQMKGVSYFKPTNTGVATNWEL